MYVIFICNVGSIIKVGSYRCCILKQLLGAKPPTDLFFITIYLKRSFRNEINCIPRFFCQFEH